MAASFARPTPGLARRAQPAAAARYAVGMRVAAPRSADRRVRVPAAAVEAPSADWAALAASLDTKSPLEIMDNVRHYD